MDVINPLSKNLPAVEGELYRDDIATRGWNLLREDFPLPQAIIKEGSVTFFL